MTDRREKVAGSAAAQWMCRTAFGRFVWVSLLSMPAYEAGPGGPAEATTEDTPAAEIVGMPARRLPPGPQGRLVVVDRKKNPLWTVLQWVALLALVIVIVAAVRVVTFGLDTTPEQATAQTGQEFPWAAASGTAERFVSVYYTVNETAPKQRTDTLAGIVPAGVDVGGVDPKGVTRAQDATTVGTSTMGTRHFVNVSFLYWTYTQKAGEWVPASSQRLVASVPVEVLNGQTVPTGAPALVPEPRQGTVTKETLNADSALTTDTAEFARAFFQTLYSDRDLSAMTAPGTSLDSLKITGAVFDSVSSWTVASGGDHREAQAVVKIKLGTTVWTQKYSLDLVRASAGNGDRWLVAGLNAN